MKRIYLDYAATTPLDPKVLEAMVPYFNKKYGNSSSLHAIGQEAKEALEKSRKTIASFMNAKEDELIFTSSGTESNNLALKGIAFTKKKGHIITEKTEHHCVLHAAEWLEKQGFSVTFLPVDRDGLISLEQLEKAIRKDTILVSIMHANNEIGTVQDIKAIGKICRKKGVLFHTDAAQSFGKLPIDVKKMNIDLMTVNAHKMYGPKGVGALFVRKGVKIEPLLHGGGHEFNLRSSTENIPGIVGFAKAVELRKKEMKNEEKEMTKLRDYLIKGVLKIEKAHLNGHPTKRLPNNANFWFSFIEGEALILYLDMEGIEASTGSACSTKSLEPSHVLTAIGLRPEQGHGSLRLTLGKYTKKSDIDYLLKVLPNVIDKLRKISPFKKKW